MNDFFSRKNVKVKLETKLFEEITGLKIPTYLQSELNKDSFIPSRVSEIANEEDIKLFKQDFEGLKYNKEQRSITADSTEESGKEEYENCGCQCDLEGCSCESNTTFEYSFNNSEDYQNSRDADSFIDGGNHSSDFSEMNIQKTQEVLNNKFIAESWHKIESELNQLQQGHETESDEDYEVVSDDVLTEDLEAHEESNNRVTSGRLSESTRVDYRTKTAAKILSDCSKINLNLHRIRLVNENITKEEEKQIHKQRKMIVKEMNRERRIQRAENSLISSHKKKALKKK